MLRNDSHRAASPEDGQGRVDDGRPHLACVGALARGFMHIWLQAATLGFAGSVVMSRGPYANVASGAFAVVCALPGLCAPLARPTARIYAWLKLAAGGAALVLWSLGEPGTQPGPSPGPATQCLAPGAAYAALLVLADDVYPLFLLAPGPLFNGTLGIPSGGLAIGASARYWWIDGPAAAALAAAVLAGPGATTARDCFSRACPDHRRVCVIVAGESVTRRPVETPERPGTPGPPSPRTTQRSHGPPADEVAPAGVARPENVWVPVVTFLGAGALAVKTVREHARGTPGPGLPLWPQVFLGGHVAVALTELCQALAPWDLTDQLLFVHAGLQVIHSAWSFLAFPEVVAYAALGGAKFAALAQVLGLRRRLHRKDPGDGARLAATLRGLFFSVYALGFGVGALLCLQSTTGGRSGD
ncbi:envelope protein UL43 [Human alphaherpesvirus 1]|nr:envelope protein UL43 [Human alphaherpesvirus 1]